MATPQVIIQAPPPVAAQQGGCNCHVPPNSHWSIKATRITSILVIISHTVALLIYGFFLWYQWAASLLAIIIASILLCCFSKGFYGTTASLFLIAFVFDIIAVEFWISLYNAVTEDDDVDDRPRNPYSSTTDDDEVVSGDWIAWLIVPPLIGAMTLLLGSFFGFMSFCKWTTSTNPHMPIQAYVGQNTVPGTMMQHIQYAQPAHPNNGPGSPPSYDQYSKR